MILPAEATDAAEVAQLWNAMIRDTDFTFTTQERTEAAVQDLIAERAGAFLIAGTAGTFAGFMTFGPFRSGPGYSATVEHSIMVVPEAVGTGLAATLLRAGEEAARAQGMHVMVAGISATNPRAIGFHRRHGYREVGRMPQVGRKKGAWLDLVLMQKIITDDR